MTQIFEHYRNTGWTIYDGFSDVIPDPLWRYARRVPRITYA